MNGAQAFASAGVGATMKHRVEQSRDGVGGVGVNDRRSFLRHDYGQRVQVVWMDGFHVQRQVCEYRAIDLSRGGLRLVGKRMHHQGTLGAVLLRRGDGAANLYGICVRNSRYASGLLYATGCAFVPVEDRLIRATRVVHGRLELSTNIEDFI
ncbi:MAG: hypothetical protein ACTS27_09095 [Phycisphaerales bacterium]